MWSFRNGSAWQRLGPSESQEVEDAFELLRSASGAPTEVPIACGTLSFESLTLQLHDGNRYRVHREVCEDLKNPYSLPGVHRPEDEAGTSDDCCGCWIWWSGLVTKGDCAEDQRGFWSLYTTAESAVLESAFREGLTGKQLDNRYYIDFTKMRQFASGNSHKHRRVLRVPFCWYWCEDAAPGQPDVKRWRAYPPDINTAIEIAWRQRQPLVKVACNIVDATGATITQPYDVLLVEMCQYREGSRFLRREIKRSGWPLLGPDRPFVFDGTVISEAPPEYWPPLNEHPERLTLADDSPLVLQIKQMLANTIGRNGHGDRFGLVPGTKKEPRSLILERVELVLNRERWRFYMTKRHELLKTMPPDHPSLQYLEENPLQTPCLDKLTNEYYQFHGCSVELVDKIADLGFDNRFAHEQGMFGRGLYFTDVCSKANQYVNCPKCKLGSIPKKPHACSCTHVDGHVFALFLCRVRLGRLHICKDYEKEKPMFKGKTNPPPNTDAILAEDKAHGGSRLEYRETIIFDRSQCYPEFIVFYRREL